MYLQEAIIQEVCPTTLRRYVNFQRLMTRSGPSASPMVVEEEEDNSAPDDDILPPTEPVSVLPLLLLLLLPYCCKPAF